MNLIKAVEKLLCLQILVRFCSAKQSPCNDSEEGIHTRSHPISKRSIFIRSLNVIFEIMINIHTPSLKSWPIFKLHSIIYSACIKTITRTMKKTLRTTKFLHSKLGFWRKKIDNKSLIGYGRLSRREGRLCRWKNMPAFTWQQSYFILESVDFLSLQLHQLDQTLPFPDVSLTTSGKLRTKWLLSWVQHLFKLFLFLQ